MEKLYLMVIDVGGGCRAVPSVVVDGSIDKGLD
jgi:hypothetical protein